MGFFAVVNEGGPQLKVERLHANLWCLPGLGRLLFYFDVGIALRLESGVVDECPGVTFGLALPFGTDPNDLPTDLGSRLTDGVTPQLIFGKPVDRQGDRITYGDVTVTLASVESSECFREANKSNREFSYWKVKLSTTLKPGESYYVRLRFRVLNTGRLWSWNPRPVAALVDVRVADVREAHGIRDAASFFRDHILNVEELAVFVVAGARLKQQNVNPEPAYVRALEGRAWEKYLGRRTYFIRPAKMLTYKWMGTDVTQDAPFRAFLELRRERGPSFVRAFLAAFLAVVLGLVLFAEVAWDDTLAHDVLTSAWVWIVATASAVSISVAWSAAAQVRNGKKWWKSIRRNYRKLEGWLYREERV